MMTMSDTQSRQTARPARRRPATTCARILHSVLAVGLSLSAAAGEQKPPLPDLNRMDLEDLMNVKVTSVSKREQRLSRTAAAVFVINQEDIRRSGATSIPDLLRMAPGVDVEQIDANAWGISVRGFNSRYSNKVLVLIDGRTVYTPSFSGVFWEHLDMPLENIDRIEVIRGPGATVWGANAVNGVISIFTKSPKETRGGLVTAGGGSQVHALGLFQYGGAAGNNGAYRVYGKFFKIGDSAMPGGSPAADHWMRASGGFRADWDLSTRDSLSVQGNLFANEASQTRRTGFMPTPFDRVFDQDVDATGGDVLARWNHTFAGGSQTSLQTYYDAYRRTDLGVPEVLRTFDLDFQHHMSAGDRHDIVWGIGYRVSNSALSPGYDIAFSPPSRTDNLYSGFLQDEIRVLDSLWFTIGCKLEHNSYTGVETEPSVRLAWSPPGGRHTLWAAASKAIRQPARQENAIRTDVQVVPIGTDAVQVIRLYGNPHFQDEEVRDYELGYRSEFTPNLSLDSTAFLSFYRHLLIAEPEPLVIVPGSPVRFEIPVTYQNRAHAITYGGEVSLNWKAASRWRISPGYAYLHATLWRDRSSNGYLAPEIAVGFPQNMLTVRSRVNLTRATEFDQSLYYTARLPGGSIPGHARLDVRLARRVGESAEVSVIGQNLLRHRTAEYGDSYGVLGTQMVRSIYGKITWRF
ncbi:MAG: TonB-dependent receptor [Terriglobia bacterium]|nr:MAG: TonB-dependent receptor [Terriglobia bacterium]